MADRDYFINIVNSQIHRDGIEPFMKWLESTDFFTAPASSRYHGNFEGGLVKHSLCVYNRFHQLSELYCKEMLPEIAKESIAICSLFHDVCKADFYTVDYRNIKSYDLKDIARTTPYQIKTDEGGQFIWKRVPYYRIEEKYSFGGHGSKSVYLIQNFIKLNPDEAAAINSHMGPWDRQDYGKPGDVYNRNLLAWLLHVADEAATYVDKI